MENPEIFTWTGSNLVIKSFLYKYLQNFRFIFLLYSKNRENFMGNIGSSGVSGRRRRGSRRNHPPPPHPPPSAQPQPEISANRYVFAAATPYPPQYPNTNPPQYYQYPGYYPHQPPVPLPLPAPYDHQHRHRGGPHIEPANWSRYACGPMMPPPPPCIENQKSVTIRSDVFLEKETLKFEADELNPGKFLVSFTFNATVAGRYRTSISLFKIFHFLDICEIQWL